MIKILSQKEILSQIQGSNNPKIVQIFYALPDKTKYVELPHDVMITLDGEKNIVESKILDGVAVFERIQRQPHQIDFKFVCRQVLEDNRDITVSGIRSPNYVFAQDMLTNIWENIFMIDSVVGVTNTMLNKLQITELVIKKIFVDTKNGSTNIDVRIQCSENYTPNDTMGQTLIIS